MTIKKKKRKTKKRSSVKKPKPRAKKRSKKTSKKTRKKASKKKRQPILFLGPKRSKVSKKRRKKKKRVKKIAKKTTKKRWDFPPTTAEVFARRKAEELKKAADAYRKMSPKRKREFERMAMIYELRKMTPLEVVEKRDELIAKLELEDDKELWGVFYGYSPRDMG